MNEREPRSDGEVLAWLRAEYAKPFAGWDFSYLHGRRHHIGDKPWDYETLVLERLATAASVLDVDTGDGKAFADASFHLVVNRHGLLDASETRRILQPGGWLVTEQVGSQTNLDIHRLLGAPFLEGPAWDLLTVRAAVETAGFRVCRAEEHFPITRYSDVGALVWYLKAIPWQIPDFYG